MAVQPGQRFDRYSVEELIGEGGMGRVYRAFDTRLERRVALKVLNPASGDGALAVTIALREARAAAAITHPNATAIYDADEIDGTSFIAMELVSGRSLRSLVGSPQVRLATRLRWLIDIAGALEAAHRMGVVHRDVKPENVMVRNDGLIKVLDFGVARRTVIDPPPEAVAAVGSPAEPGTSLTPATPATLAGSGVGGAGGASSGSRGSGPSSSNRSGAHIAGTPAYMAPEQIRGDPLDGRADQFGWGVLAYELLTGRLPWLRAKDVVAYIAAVVTEDPLPPSELAVGIPPAVDAAVLRALSKSPAARFPTMHAAAAELAPYARGSLGMVAIAASPEEEDDTPPVGTSPNAGTDPTVLLSDLDPPDAQAAATALVDSASGPNAPVTSAVPPVSPAAPPVSPAAPPAAERSLDPTSRPGSSSSSSRRPPPLSPRRPSAEPPLSPRRPSAEPPPSSARASSPGARSRPSHPGSDVASRPHPSGHDAGSRPGSEGATPRIGPLRSRRPFGPSFHEPDFDGPVDLDAHLVLLPADATCKGFFCADMLQQVAKVAPEREVFRLAQLSERRYTGFRDYPMAENLRLAVAAARILYPRYALGEGLRRLGQANFDALLATHVGRAVFGVLGRDVEQLLSAGPKAFKLMLSTGQMLVDKTGFRTFVFRATEFPAFLETYQVGLIEGVVRHCGERARVRIALEDLSTATIELRLI